MKSGGILRNNKKINVFSFESQSSSFISPNDFSSRFAALSGIRKKTIVVEKLFYFKKKKKNYRRVSFLF